MDKYLLRVTNYEGEIVVEGKFICTNGYWATKKFINELGNIDLEEDDIAELIELETGKVVNSLKF